MTQQFDRVIEIQVDTVTVGGLDARFRVVKTLNPKAPNTCELVIFNLNEQRRDQLGQLESATAEISAGYKGRQTTESTAALQAVDDLLGIGGAGADSGVGLIFKGDLRDISSVYEPPDWVTTLESGDGEKAKQFSRVNRSFTQGTSLSNVMTAVASDMGVGLGNVAQQALSGRLLEAGSSFINGVTVSGPAHKEFDRLVRSSGLEWSVQDGNLQLLGVGQTLQDTAVVLKPDTGLIGSPTIGSDGVARMTALINSDIVPGRLLNVESVTLEGRFRAERCEYVGSKFDNDFYVNIEASQL